MSEQIFLVCTDISVNKYKMKLSCVRALFTVSESCSGHTLVSPCIMCAQYIGGCSVHQGDTMSALGDIMSTSGGVQYIGAYHDACGGIS